MLANNPLVDFVKRNPVKSALISIFIGSLGSGLWDIGLKPSLSWLSQSFLSIITFGSESAKNHVYENAALDPTSLPSLLLLIALGGCLAAACLMPPISTLYILSKTPMNKTVVAADESGNESTKMDRLNRFKNTSYVMIVIGSLLTGVVLTYTALINQSVLVWRVYHADLKICAPYMSTEQITKLEARFAAMKTKAEYLEINGTLQDIADNNALKLHSKRVW